MDYTVDYTPGAVANLLTESEGNHETSDSTGLFNAGKSKKSRKSYEKSMMKRVSSSRMQWDNEPKKKDKMDQLSALFSSNQVETEDSIPVTEDSEQEPEKTPKKRFTKTTPEEKLEKSEKKLENRPRRDRKNRDQEQESRTVFVGNLPKTIKKKVLKKTFECCGAIDTIRLRSAAPADLKLPKKAIVIREKFHSARTNINAYVVFEDSSSVAKAVAMNGQEVDGHHIRVDQSGNAKQHNKKCSIFVGNLPFDVEEDQVRRHFADCGDIENIRVIRDATTGLGKGIAFVIFKDKDGVDFAVKLNDHKMDKRKLRVSKTVEKKLQQKDIKRFKSSSPKSPSAAGVKKSDNGKKPAEGKKAATVAPRESKKEKPSFQGTKAVKSHAKTREKRKNSVALPGAKRMKTTTASPSKKTTTASPSKKTMAHVKEKQSKLKSSSKTENQITAKESDSKSTKKSSKPRQRMFAPSNLKSGKQPTPKKRKYKKKSNAAGAFRRVVKKSKKNP